MRPLLCLSLCLLACKEEPDGADATPIDAVVRDAADAGREDADPTDGDPIDGDRLDADPIDGDQLDADPNDGEPNDADPIDGNTPDNGMPDTGVVDTGPIDGGFLPTFTQNTISDSFLHAQAATLVDIEGDGDLDVLGSISLDDSIRLYLNNGNGSAWNAIDVSPVGTIVGMHSTAADLDGDGDLDVAAVGLFDRNNCCASEGEVTWYRNPGNPSGSWTEVPITGLTFWGPRYIAAGDLTGDGDDDLIVGATQRFDFNGGEQGHGVHWFRNTGGAFAGPTAIDPDLLRVEVVLIHDVDADGVLDVIASGNQSDEIVWYENQRPPGMVQANPTFVRHTLFAITGPQGLALAQRDGDAALELFATGDNGSGGVITELDAPANPANPWSSSPVVTNFGAASVVRIAAADLNLDGLVDVAVASNDDASIRTYIDDGSGGWTLRIVQEPFAGVDFVAAGDIDRDGIIDLVTGTYSHDPNFDRFDWWRTRP